MFNAKNFGIAGGLVCGLLMFFFTWVAILTGHGAHALELMMSMFPGYATTIVGSFVGFVYGFIKGFVVFFGIAWFYNWLSSS